MTVSPRTTLMAALLAAALFAWLVPQARAAVRWPGFGGDPGRSGHQTTPAGSLPVKLAWTRDDGAIRTSPVISGGAPDQQRVMYGTADGVVHLRRLSDGARVGRTDVSQAADAFGARDSAESVSFADTSSEDALGQLFAAHNDAGGSRSRTSTKRTARCARSCTCPGRPG